MSTTPETETTRHATSDPVAPWNVREQEFPREGNLWEQLGFCLKYAVLAPSSHNSQPWRFKLGLGDVELHADRTRALPVVDPHDRELLISCGAALFHLRLALRYFGFTDEVEPFPDPDNPDLLATVRPGEPRQLRAEEQAMFHAIPRRRTSRLPFENRPLPENLLNGLAAAAEREGAALNFIRDETQRDLLAHLVWQADCAQLSDRAFRRELAAWIHSGRAATHDGIPGYAYGVNKLLDFASPAYALALRTFDLGSGVGAHDRKLVEGSPVLAVFTTPGDTLADWLAAGQALARVLLLATAHGVSSSYLNQPLEHDGSRPQFRAAFDLPGRPQLILRLGYGVDGPPTPRRDVREVLL